MSRRDAVGVLVDEELTVSAVDRVVQDGLVQPDLDVLDLASGRYSVSALRILAGMASPMPSSSPRSATCGLSGSPSAILTVTPAAALVGKDARGCRRLRRGTGRCRRGCRSRARRTRRTASIPRGEPTSGAGRPLPALRVASARVSGPSGVGPEVGFVRADEVGQRRPVVRVGDAPVQPAPDGLGIDAQACGDVVFAQPRS